MKKDPIVIIGSGLAGYTFAKEFRKLDKTTPLEIITASDGRFYSKPLLSTALTHQKTPDALAMYDAESMVSQLNANIYVRTLVKSIDLKAQLIHLEDRSIPYSQLVLACGSKAVSPPLSGNAVSEVPSVNDLEAYTKFREWLSNKKRLAILGAGLVGCEFANDLMNAGYDVEIIAPDPYPLARFVPEPIGRVLEKTFREKGVKWRLGRLAQSIDHASNGFAVTLDNGEQIHFDGVFSAIGLKAACELAKSAGINTNRGILVDRYLRTNISNIYALGDCAEVSGEVRQYVAPILQCARALANLLAGGNQPVVYPPMPIVVKTSHCPVVVSPPPSDIEGEWRFEGNDTDLGAHYYDQNEKLRGFALVGAKVKDRMLLTKKLPPVFG